MRTVCAPLAALLGMPDLGIGFLAHARPEYPTGARSKGRRKQYPNPSLSRPGFLLAMFFPNGC